YNVNDCKISNIQIGGIYYDEHSINITHSIRKSREILSKERSNLKDQNWHNRFSYAEMGKRTRSLSSALDKLGVHQGDKVGTLAWNDHRHLEAYFAIPSMGAVLHTINIRLNKEHLIHII